MSGLEDILQPYTSSETGLTYSQELQNVISMGITSQTNYASENAPIEALLEKVISRRPKKKRIAKVTPPLITGETPSRNWQLSPAAISQRDKELKHNAVAAKEIEEYITTKMSFVPQDCDKWKNLELVAYADGSALRNGTKEAVAGIGVYWKDGFKR